MNGQQNALNGDEFADLNLQSVNFTFQHTGEHVSSFRLGSFDLPLLEPSIFLLENVYENLSEFNIKRGHFFWMIRQERCSFRTY
jgi:hypothetical protein